FTSEQAKLLSRFTKRVVINYDGDSAGIKAARRAIEELLLQDLEIKVLVLPDGQDHDDLFRANGAEYVYEACGPARPIMSLVLDATKKGRRSANDKQRAEAIEKTLPVLAAIRNPIQKRQSFDEAMTFFRMEDRSLNRDLWHTVKNGRSAEPETVKRQVRRVT